MQKNVRIHKKTYSMHITKNLSPLNENNNLSQLEKDIFILINYIRTNPLDFSNELIKNNKKFSKKIDNCNSNLESHK